MNTYRAGTESNSIWKRYIKQKIDNIIKIRKYLDIYANMNSLKISKGQSETVSRRRTEFFLAQTDKMPLITSITLIGQVEEVCDSR
jgi:isocitrate/isopropylmalate dehydrogenase